MLMSGQDVERYLSNVRLNNWKVLRALGPSTKYFERFSLSFNKLKKKTIIIIIII